MISTYSKTFFLFIISFNILFADAPDPVKSEKGMVVSASKLASMVGASILQKGGNAIDAAVAVGFALSVTYPSAGNIGGGGFMVIHTKDGKDIAIDFRETAPLSSHKDMYLDSSGNIIAGMSSEDVTSTGIPGSVAGLLYALNKYGTMQLKDVIQPAINLATDGFQLEYRAAESFKHTLKDFLKYPSSARIFSKSGLPYLEGDIFKQPDLAKTLTLVRDQGINGFYKGEVADLIVKQVKSSGGFITHEDLANYKVKEREPIYGTYKGYKIVSMPPPSSGGIALVQLLNILENFQFNKDDFNSSSYVHKLVESMKQVYADRSEHLGDQDFYRVPVKWLISKDYAKFIYNNILDTAIPSSKIEPGNQPGFESRETTHYSVYDSFGNAVSTTTTINSSYGNKVVVDGAGFLLNNEMDDFSVKPGEPNQFGLLGNEANAIQSGKRMLSSMTPTIILKDNKPFLIIGSPGGSTIITVVLQVILNTIEFNMDIQEAINAPRFHHQWYPDQIDYEKFSLSVDTKDNLLNKGHVLGNIVELGRAEGIIIKNGVIYGATDPRGYGAAVGY